MSNSKIIIFLNSKDIDAYLLIEKKSYLGAIEAAVGLVHCSGSLIITSAISGEGGYVFTCLVCLFVCRKSQKVVGSAG